MKLKKTTAFDELLIGMTSGQGKAPASVELLAEFLRSPLQAVEVCDWQQEFTNAASCAGSLRGVIQGNNLDVLVFVRDSGRRVFMKKVKNNDTSGNK